MAMWMVLILACGIGGNEGYLSGACIFAGRRTGTAPLIGLVF